MSLSYLAPENMKTRISSRAVKAWFVTKTTCADVARELRMVTASAGFKPVFLRVTTALSLSYGLVQITKHLLM